MPAKTSEVDPAAIKGWIADARKKPISFAILTGGSGLVMQADKVRSPDQMRKAAKSSGGTKGCWGKMEVQQKTLVLTYEGNPPGGFDKQIRKLLSDAGAAMRVEMQSLAAVDAAAEAEARAAEEEERAAAEAAASRRRPPDEAAEATDATGATAGGVAGRRARSESAAPDEGEPPEDEDEEEASDLPTVLKLARKKPLNFACMLSDAGVVLVTHRRKNWGILVKQAKGQGGSAKGAWGTLSVEGKVVVLSCVEDPPGSLARRLKIKLRDEGQKYSVAIRSPAGEAVEADDDEEGAEGPVGAAPPEQETAAPARAAAASEEETAGNGASVEEEIARAARAIESVRAALSGKQAKMFEKLTETARAQASAAPAKASATLKLLTTKLDALGLEPDAAAPRAAADTGADTGGDELAERRLSRLSEIGALRARAEAVLTRIQARRA